MPPLQGVEPTDADEVEGSLYDAIGHLEAAIAKLGIAEIYSGQPSNTARLRAWTEQLEQLVEGARELHEQLRPQAATGAPTDELAFDAAVAAMKACWPDLPGIELFRRRVRELLGGAERRNNGDDAALAVLRALKARDVGHGPGSR
jgi:hypothetical protein